MRTIPPPSDVFFKGRTGDPRLGEWVKVDTDSKGPYAGGFGLLGCPDDTGVRLNRGRPGADKGPDQIRKALYKMALPDGWPERFLIDAGNTPVSNNISVTHDAAREAAERIVKSGLGLITLGGGHDFAFPCFEGFASGIRMTKAKARLGLINVDPHLDVRELLNDKPHSGTPFRQLVSSGVLSGKSFVEFGTRKSRNAFSHFQFCKQQGIQVIPFEVAVSKDAALNFGRALQALSTSHDFLGVTIDMDSCCEAEGTSAAPVIGFSARELYQMATLAGKNPKVRYFEIAEVAPSLDSYDRSARVAAELIFAFLDARTPLMQRPSAAMKNKQSSAKNVKKRQKP